MACSLGGRGAGKSAEDVLVVNSGRGGGLSKRCSGAELRLDLNFMLL